jgi:DNA-directed RNA polymerase II subunit RPB2
MITDNNIWKVIDLYFKKSDSDINRLIKHQIESFDQFINEKLNEILTESDNIFFIKKINNKTYKNRLIFDSPQITDPIQDDEELTLMTPQIARDRNLCYSARVYVNITQVQDIISEDGKVETHIIDREKIHLTKLPIMIGSSSCVLHRMKETKFLSNECKFDIRGYFIVNGGEKVIIPQERLIENKILVLKKKDQSSLISVAEIRSIATNGVAQAIVMKYKKNGFITITAPQFRDKNEIPLVILLRALGLISEKDISDFITFGSNDEEIYYKLLPSLNNYYLSNDNESTAKIKNQEDALSELVKYVRKIYKTSDEIVDNTKITYLKEILVKEFMPHMGGSLISKALFLCYMANKLLSCVIGRNPYDDRDNYINKRLDLPGPLLCYILRQSLKKLIIECGKNFKKKSGQDCKLPHNTPSIISHVKPTTIEKDIKSVLLTGSWGIQNIKSRKGVAQVLKRLTHLDTLSYMRRFKSPTGDSTAANKMIAPRLLHNTQFGMICPVETPEGQPVGLVKHLALSTSVTIDMYSQNFIIMNLLENDYIEIENIKPYNLLEHTKLFLNGKLFGISINGFNIYNKLKNARFNFIIEKTVSICFNYANKEIRINSDGGRFYRPLLVVENNKLNITNEMINEISTNMIKSSDISSWNDFLLKYPNTIEFLDIEECQFSLIAQNQDSFNQENNKIYKKYSHCEIHPSLLLGVVANSIPLCDHNQSPRNTYQCAQARQAMGIYASNYRYRMITLGYTLYYPQRPIITTRAMKYIHSQELPAGQTVVVAIACYSGYNQEDSIIFNQGAIDRGIFRSTFYRKYDDTIQKNPTTSKKEIFTKPNEQTTSKIKLANYNKLQENGLPCEETYVNGNDIIIGKISPNLNTDITEKPYTDCSKTIRANEHGIIDKVMNNIYNADEYEICKVSVRSERIPIVGDKFSSRGGQKGTVGIILKHEDMPYTKEGIVPDLIINPHCIPSRMTIGQLLECIMGKVGAIEGRQVDGTPFQKLNIDEFGDKLKEYGYSSNGSEKLRCGMTGKILDSEIFIGPTYYQRLKHMVEDKIHSRASGPLQILTRQPAEGRSRDGGFRFGEMERDCIIAHGTSLFLKERLYDSSDPYILPVCRECGLFARNIKNSKQMRCDVCDNTKTIEHVKIPYAFKLLIQELQSIHIAARFRLEN